MALGLRAAPEERARQALEPFEYANPLSHPCPSPFPLEPRRMARLSYLITPHYAPPIDTSGVSSLKPSTPAIPTEAESAVDLAKRAAAIGQVDDLLVADQQLRDQLASRKAKLLAAVGYDSDSYLKWVADGEREADNS